MTRDARLEKEKSDVPFGSNDVRLSLREWVVAGMILAGLVWLAPVLWERAEKFDPGSDYRIPYSLGSDYSMFDRYCRRVVSEDKTLLIGDSVVWGHYVACDETLSHYLNERSGEDRFANLGVDGIHPAAMAGLVDCYGRRISGRRVIVHCNLLWMSSKRRDLRDEKEFSFNHPELVPQLVPWIPCYRQSVLRRLGIIVKRNVRFFGWTGHVRAAYFDGATLPGWTIEHPRADPAAAVAFRLPSPDELPSPKPVAKPWTEKRLARFNPPWVKLRASFQWKCFRRTVETLRRRGNRVFVLVGPFNEHMLTDEGLGAYKAIESDVEAWLRERKIPYDAPAALPSRCYADASHPLADGYALWAKELLQSESFRRFDSAG